MNKIINLTGKQMHSIIEESIKQILLEFDLEKEKKKDLDEMNAAYSKINASKFKNILEKEPMYTIYDGFKDYDEILQIKTTTTSHMLPIVKIDVGTGFNQRIYFYDDVNGVWWEEYNNSDEPIQQRIECDLIPESNVCNNISKDLYKYFLHVQKILGKHQPKDFLQAYNKLEKIVNSLKNEKTSKIYCFEHYLDINGTWICNLAGGLNGLGNWHDYFNDLANIIKTARKHGIHMWVISMKNDCCDDLFDCKVGFDYNVE